MTRLATLTAILASLVLAGVATAAPIQFNPVTLDGKRVQAKLVGGISVEPCSRASGCARGIVSLRWGGTEVSQHHVRCLRPAHLHTVRAHQGPHHAFAFVYACRKTYRWMLR